MPIKVDNWEIPLRVSMIFYQIRKARNMQVLSFSMSKENFSAASMVLLFVLKTRVKKPEGQLGMNPK